MYKKVKQEQRSQPACGSGGGGMAAAAGSNSTGPPRKMNACSS